MAIRLCLALAMLISLALSLAVAHLRKRVKRIEAQRLLEPSTLIGSSYALEGELENLFSIGEPLGYAEMQAPSRAVFAQLMMALRATCCFGVDQVFAGAANTNRAIVLSVGKQDPEAVGQYFLQELAARQLHVKIGWAYCCSPDPAIRKKLPDAAHKALSKVSGDQGVAVELVEQESWPAETGAEVLMPGLARRREQLCLSVAELGIASGLGATCIKQIEGGRACQPKTREALLSLLGLIEESIQRVRNLSALQAAQTLPADRS